jgi:phosphoribosylamine---glycine ligase
MKILVVGSGGREHALCWALARSEGVDEVAVCPGNGGTEWAASEGVARCRRVAGEPLQIAHDFDLVVVGPEAPLVDGLADKLVGVPVFGPSSKAAQIEASKHYAKSIMKEQGVPTARHEIVTSVEQLAAFGTPVVVKDDGLAAGKGVGVFETLEEARAFFVELSASSERIFVEEFLSGPELSVLAFCDGMKFSLMPPARDYKRRFENDAGPNTGGMGAISPVTDLPDGLLQSVGTDIIAPVLQGLAQDGAPFVGVLYAGLKLTPDGPKVLEFNCRFGDPETQVILPQFDGNLAKLMLSCAEGNLDQSQVSWNGRAHTTVVMASDGYPGSYEKGFPIDGLETEGGLIFQAGTTRENGHVVTAGGRVLAVVGRGNDLKDSTRAAYELVESVSFEGAVFRKDIGS